jgi:hypothetical protein
LFKTRPPRKGVPNLEIAASIFSVHIVEGMGLDFPPDLHHLARTFVADVVKRETSWEPKPWPTHIEGPRFGED